LSAVVIAVRTLSTTDATLRLKSHNAGTSGLIGGPIVTSIRLKGRSISVPRTATGQMGTPACSAK